MNPMEYIENLEAMLNTQLVGGVPREYSHEEHIKHLLHYTGLIKSIIETAQYEVALETIGGVQMEIKGMKCTQTDIDENLVIFQALPGASMGNFENLEEALREMAKNGQLAGRRAILIPADARCLKAKVLKKTPEKPVAPPAGGRYVDEDDDKIIFEYQF